MSSAADRLLDSSANPRIFSVMRVGIGIAALLRAVGVLMEALLSDNLDASRAMGIGLMMALAVCVTVGFRAREAALTLAIAWFGLLILDTTLFYANHGYLIAVSMILVGFADSERYLAIRPRGQGPTPSWPLFLFRCQVSLVYGFAGLAKINEQFLAGEVLRNYAAGAFLPVGSLTSLMPTEMMQLLSAAVIITELFVAGALWFRALRPIALGLVIPLHLGMLIFAGPWIYFYGIIVFALLMIVLLASFVEAPEHGRLVVWDDSCSFCRSWIAVFQRLDAFGALRFVGSSSPAAYRDSGVSPEAAAVALQLAEPDRPVRSGWAAVQGIVSALPGGNVIAPYMSLPVIRHIGDRAYRRVAARRTCAYLAAAGVHSR